MAGVESTIACSPLSAEVTSSISASTGRLIAASSISIRIISTSCCRPQASAGAVNRVPTTSATSTRSQICCPVRKVKDSGWSSGSTPRALIVEITGILSFSANCLSGPPAAIPPPPITMTGYRAAHRLFTACLISAESGSEVLSPEGDSRTATCSVNASRSGAISRTAGPGLPWVIARNASSSSSGTWCGWSARSDQLTTPRDTANWSRNSWAIPSSSPIW